MIEDKLTQMQRDIDLIECYRAVVISPSYLNKAVKDKYLKLGVYEQVEKELKEFCEKRLNELVYGDVEAPMNEVMFTSDEILMLKRLVANVKSKADAIARHQPQTTPTNPPPPLTQRVPKKDKGPSRNVIDADETQGQLYSNFIGRNTRTLGHSTLQTTATNAPGSYSLVKILDINENDKIAKIEFLTSGDTGTIHLSELSGFEYLEF